MLVYRRVSPFHFWDDFDSSQTGVNLHIPNTIQIDIEVFVEVGTLSGIRLS